MTGWETGNGALISHSKSSHTKVTNSPKTPRLRAPIFLSLVDPPRIRSCHGREAGGDLGMVPVSTGCPPEVMCPSLTPTGQVSLTP